MAEKELQEKVLAYRLLEARLDGLIKQRNLVFNKIAEIESTLATIEEVETGPENILIPLGSEAHAQGKIVEKGKMIVEIGAGVALEKTVEEAKQILNKRKSELNSAASDLQREIEKTSQIMQRLSPEIESLLEKIKAE